MVRSSSPLNIGKRENHWTRGRERRIYCSSSWKHRPKTKTKNLLQLLLEAQAENKDDSSTNNQEIRSMLMDIVGGGNDTTATLAELLKNLDWQEDVLGLGTRGEDADVFTGQDAALLRKGTAERGRNQVLVCCQHRREEEDATGGDPGAETG
ncbi:hypothetical protein MLD38_023845 [Melastoma candidum]|uniref:Uncharacterized protein n=1 Tax=Melastoma candidum TaxID=119954 RepID=A0ACB9NRI2_9MYRT|nr:hypothetical protein MLD38_023845 [Melastoma candidum]